VRQAQSNEQEPDPRAGLPHKRGSDLYQSTLDVANDERRFHPNDAISGALERRITAGVSATAFAVIRTVDLNH